MLLLAGIAGSLYLYFHFAGSNPYSGAFSDSVRYLFMADYFSGADSALTLQMVQESMFPPLFPLLLSLLGAGTDNFIAGHLVTVLSLVLACLSFFWWLSEHRLPLNQSLAVILLLLLLPGVFFQSLAIASEWLFLALVLASLAAMKRSEASPRWIYAAALLAGLSIVTRTVGIALLPSLFLACRPGALRKLPALAVLSLSPYLSWEILRDVQYSGVGYIAWYAVFVEQFGLAGVFRSMAYQLKMMWFSWILMFDRMAAMHVIVLHSLLLAVAAAVFAARLVKLKSEAVFLLAYLVIIAFWPFPDQVERFIFVLAPLYLFYGLLAVNWSVSRFGLAALGRLPEAAATAVILVSIVPSLLFYQHRFSLDAPDDIIGHRYSQKWYEAPTDRDMFFRTRKFDRLFEVASAIDEHIPEDECVYATFADVVSLYSGRKGVSLPFDMYRDSDSGPAYSLDKLELCDYVMMTGLRMKQVREYEAMYPIKALDGHLDPILVSNLTHEGKLYTVAAFARIVR